MRDCRILGDVVSIQTVDSILYKVRYTGDPAARGTRMDIGAQSFRTLCFLARCDDTTPCSCRPSYCDDNGRPQPMQPSAQQSEASRTLSPPPYSTDLPSPALFPTPSSV